MLDTVQSDYQLSCRLNVDSKKSEILDEMIAVQSAVYFEEVEIVFDKIHKFEIPSFLHLSLGQGRESAASKYIKVFPALIHGYEGVMHMFQAVLTDRKQIEWHDLRNHFLKEHRADLELLLRVHPKHNHIFGSIVLREQEYESTFTASETP